MCCISVLLAQDYTLAEHYRNTYPCPLTLLWWINTMSDGVWWHSCRTAVQTTCVESDIKGEFTIVKISLVCSLMLNELQEAVNTACQLLPVFILLFDDVTQFRNGNSNKKSTPQKLQQPKKMELKWTVHRMMLKFMKRYKYLYTWVSWYQEACICGRG